MTKRAPSKPARTPSQPALTEAGRRAQAERQERLAKALRDNLKRRKRQARARGDRGGDTSGGAGG